MAFSLNKIMLIGNLGQDAETRFTTSNKSVTSFSLATTNSHKDKDGNWVNDTTWHKCIFWELSDYLKPLLVKGAKFYVEGRLSIRDYVDKEGVKKYITEVVAYQLIPLDKAEQSSQSSEIPPAVRKGQYEDSPKEPAQDDDLPF